MLGSMPQQIAKEF